MIIQFGKQFVEEQLKHQLKNMFLITEDEEKQISKWLDLTLERVDHCFAHSSNKYYYRTVDEIRYAFFNPLHATQWFIFLYFFANTIHKNGTQSEIERKLCDELYGLSKMVSAADLYYEIEMPKVFFCDHPVGTVIGRAQYGENFSFIQGCTVGNNKGCYPIIGENVTMMSNSKILGNSHIGNNVIIAANAYVKDIDIPDNSIVFGESPNLIIKPHSVAGK